MSSRADPTGDGERVSHRYANDLFHAHLSLYAHAAAWARGADVLDVGCGTGYGTDHLLRHGARSVVGLDLDRSAVALATVDFARAGLSFAVGDAVDLPLAGGPAFDLAVALNVLEHVPDVPAVLMGVVERLRPEGVLVVAVPPANTPRERAAELANPWHLNIWTARQWRRVVGAWFEDVRLYRHVFLGSGPGPDFRNRPEDDGVQQTDFGFVAVADEDDLAGTYTVVLVAARPVEPGRRPMPGTRVEMVDGSMTRRRPTLVPLPPDQADHQPRPLRQLPRKAWRMTVERGPSAALTEARGWAVWRLRRAMTLRELRRR